MNIYEMLRRGDSDLIVSPEVKIAKREYYGEIWRGLLLPPGASIRLRGALRFHTFRERPAHCNWTISANKAERAAGVGVKFVAATGDTIITKSETIVDAWPRPLLLPWPLGRAPLPPDVDLVVHTPTTSPGGVFLGVHRIISRAPLLAAACGRGVEIGPGANPQVLPRDGVDVSYLEQMPVSDWERLYPKAAARAIDRTLWNRYLIGEAHDLPFADESLDFIFSSHVFEHLANPLGHLGHWHDKLRSGGTVLCIVPEIAGAKDGKQSPCMLQDLVDEYEKETWAPTIDHYRRYCAMNSPKKDPAELMRQRRSIHVHFYTNGNMAALLERACQMFAYAGFHIQHSPNNKDFHFVAIKA